jgi:hypothetical protein
MKVVIGEWVHYSRYCSYVQDLNFGHGCWKYMKMLKAVGLYMELKLRRENNMAKKHLIINGVETRN